MDVALPNPPQKAQLNSTALNWKSLPDAVYRFKMNIDQKEKLTIQY